MLILLLIFFMDSATSLFNEHVPLVRITRRESNLLNKPWIQKVYLLQLKLEIIFFMNIFLSTPNQHQSISSHEIQTLP